MYRHILHISFYTGILTAGLLLADVPPCLAQEKTIVTDSAARSTRKTVIAGKYKNKKVHNFFFGKNYRDEWETPVVVNSMMLDTAGGGLTPYEAGGGRQSKSLKLRDKDNREYVLRSVDKSFGRALPEKMQNTFIEDLIDDQVTIGHPYSAVTIPDMAEAAGIRHTNPIIRYVPEQRALDSFNKNYGQRLYLLEQRPDENWETAGNFGNAKNIISTDKMMAKLLKSNENEVDQQLYIRSRLFDIFIGDWGRHEDQWRWAEFKKGDKTVYEPVPRDRDQAYTQFDGLLTKLTLRAAHIKHLHTFNNEIRNIKTYNYTTRHLDRRIANETTLEQWTSIAKDVENRLTDEVIENAIRKLPPEVYAISGAEITSKLKARRGHLLEYATKYYLFLARHVDVVGSQETDYFEVNRVNDKETKVALYHVDKNGMKEDEPSYSRTFNRSETQDIRLYGISGNDKFDIEGKVDHGINVRIIGGDGKDSIIDQSVVRDGRRMTNVYDDRNNYLLAGRESKLHLHTDSATHSYDYNEFEYHNKGVRLGMSYDNPDRYFIGLGYVFGRHYWRKYPMSFDQGLFLRYSISQNAFRVVYNGTFYQALGKWDAYINAWQDAVRWTNFYGLGNETQQLTNNRRYYQLRTDEFYLGVGLKRDFGKRHNLDLSAYYQGIEIINDPNRFVAENYTPSQLYYFEHHQYLSAKVGYTYQHVNDKAVPTKGIMFYAGAAYSKNILEMNKGFATYNSILQLYIPLFGKFSYAMRSGITTVDGQPEFYQYASVGGSQTIRGYRRDRFWGKTAFYNSNELRWITDLRSYVMNGKIGVVGFLDDGRVWMPNENSNTLHIGYGGGILLAPFDLATISVTYGASKDGGLVHLRFSKVM